MDLNSDAWIDLVFEGKNRKYGAYYLRKTSSKRHLYALAIVGSFVIVLIFSYLVIQYYYHPEDVKLQPVNISELKMMEYVGPEDFESVINDPSLKEVAQLTPPEITEDEELLEEIKEELQEETVVSEGLDSLASHPVADTVTHQELLHSKAEQDSVFLVHPEDQTAEFQTLRTRILQYIYRNLKYPDVAHKQKIQGRIICSFIINEDGRVSDITLIQRGYIFLDEEALRVLHSMPVWDPIQKGGKPVKVKYYIPIVFSL